MEALLMATITKPHFTQLPYKLCIFSFLKVASSCYERLFGIMVLTYENFHCNIHTYMYFIAF